MFKKALISVLLPLLSLAILPAAWAGRVMEADRPDSWELVFEDDFNREELGKDWEIKEGTWEIRDGRLYGDGTIVINRKFRGFHKLEFKGTAEENPCDLSPFIHSSGEGVGSGYFLQFGGYYNRGNIYRRDGAFLGRDSTHLIETGKTHEITAKFDGEKVFLKVDGETVFEYAEDSPLLGAGYERAGIYIYMPSYIEEVKVYLKPAE